MSAWDGKQRELELESIVLAGGGLAGRLVQVGSDSAAAVYRLVTSALD